MTAQIPDKFTYRDLHYTVANVSASNEFGVEFGDEGLFNPAMFNLKPSMAATLCRRGYVVTYSLINNQLVIADLRINLREEGDQEYRRREERPFFVKASPKATIKQSFQYLLEKLTRKMEMPSQPEAPNINGVEPIKLTRENSLFNHHYGGINYHLEYSGGLLIANDPITHPKRGIYSPCKYKNVVELVFDNGVLVGEFDRSEIIS